MRTIYTSRKRVAREMTGSTHTLPILIEYAWSMARVWLEYGWSMARVWLQPRIAISLLLLLMVGSGNVWGQDTPEGPAGTDFSGYYYIANWSGDVGTTKGYNEKTPTTNYYLCPAEPDPNAGNNYFYGAIYYDYDASPSNNQMPYLTTYRTGKVEKAVWKIEYKETVTENNEKIDYYYIRYCSDNNKYLTHNTSRAAANTRYTVHLQTELDGNNSMFCFETGADGSYFIRPRSVSSGNRHLNPATGNKNEYYGTGANSKKTKINGTTVDPGGMIGYYTSSNHLKSNTDDQASQWYLEKLSPVISYNSSNLIEISYIDGATIYYTTDGNDPPTSGDEHKYSVAFEPPAGTTTIKAVAIKGGEVSDIATFTYIKLADSYVIQSKDCEFYNLIPNLKIGEDEYPKNLTTLNVPCNTMVWDFENAVDGDGQYYYIHNSQGGYMYYTATDNGSKYVYFKDNNIDTNDKGYKFDISVHASGGFNIVPKGQTIPINKPSITGSGDDTKLGAVKLTGKAGDATSRWALIPYSEETKRTSLPQWRSANPFTKSDGGHTYYYRIKSVSQPTMPLILDNDGSIKSKTVPTTSYDTRKSVWVIKNVGTDTDDLLDYYTFQNAYTGELLYYNGQGRGIKDTPPVLQIGKPDGADDTWSHFVVVQTVSGYNIIPKAIVDKTKAISRVGSSDYPGEGFNCINRAGGGDSPGTWYDNDGGSRWTFEQKTDVKCMNPTYAEDTYGNFTISCVTNAAVIHYTTNGEDPTASSGVYSAPIESATEKICIKAIAIVGDGVDDYSKSEIITLMNKPDITLKDGTTVVDDNTYIYDGTAKEPSVTISIGGVVAPTNTYTITYADNTNAGNIPTVTIEDVADDLWIIKPNTASKTFVINPRNLTLTWTNTELEYTGTEQKPTLTVGNIVEGETLTITVSIVEDGGGINMGTYTAAATIEPNSNYVLPTDVPLTTSYTINPKILGDGTDPAADISIDITYDGNAYTVTVKQGESTTLTEGESNDYTKTGSASANGKYYIVTVTGQGNYEGSFTTKYALVKFDHKTASGEFSGTFVSDAGDGDFAVPDGMKAYIITDIRVAVDQVVAVEVGYIPEGVPVLLLYDDDDSADPAKGFLVKPKDDEIATVSTANNLLKVTMAETSFNTGKIYLLYKGEFVLNKAGNLAAGKIYLDNTTGDAHASRLAIVWDESTDVEEIITMIDEERGAVWYTMDGRRLSGKPTTKGLYIRNREKRVVR